MVSVTLWRFNGNSLNESPSEKEGKCATANLNHALQTGPQ